MRIARVFPRATRATPTDALAFVGDLPLIRPEIDRVHVSVAFTWDLPEAERLAESWGRFYPTEIGGPATGARGEDFEPGMYLRPGYVITSRGCPNKCWFCSVWRREGHEVRELPIREGWNVLDDNILATSREHFAAVCEMLKRQSRPAEFTGGLEAARLTEWHVDQLAEVKPRQLFFAYDTADDLEPLREAATILPDKWKPPRGHHLRCYVLVGYPGDSFETAEERLRQVLDCGMVPMAMLYRDREGTFGRRWRQFQREWANPTILGVKVRKADAVAIGRAAERRARC